MTPWQFKCCVRAAERQRTDDFKDNMALAWKHASLSRQERLPDLKTMLAKFGQKNQVQRIDENTILARFKAYQADRDKKKGAE